MLSRALVLIGLKIPCDAAEAGNGVSRDDVDERSTGFLLLKFKLFQDVYAKRATKHFLLKQITNT